MFDVLLRELATRFGLGDKANDVLAALLALVFDRDSGGFDGFVQRLRAGGLDKQVDSWLGRGENLPVNSAAVERALGAPLLQALAQKAELAPARMASALTALLPGVMDKLSPDGVRPLAGSVPAAVAPLLAAQSGFAQQARSLWPAGTQPVAAAVTATPLVTHPQPVPAHDHAQAHDDHGHHDGPAADGGMGGRWIVWAALAGILAAAYGWFGSISAPVTTPATSITSLPSTTPVAPAPAASGQATLRLEVSRPVVRLSGVVDGNAAQRSLQDAALAQFGERLQMDIKTDARVGPAPWLNTVLGALPQLDRPGLDVELSGLYVDLRNLPEQGDAGMDLVQLAPLFGKLRRGGLFDPAVRAFATLPQQDLQAGELVAALNLMRVYFESGSRTLRDDSRRILLHAAEVIRRAPEDTLIEIGGHTDSRGDAQANRELSEQRAFAVQEALVVAGVHPSRLTARGYGSSVPVAENSSREGRAQNRRIEFSLLR